VQAKAEQSKSNNQEEPMIDPASLATAAVALATPYLIEFLKDAAKGAASGAGKSAWDWIKGRLTTAAGQEATTDLETKPDDGANVKAVEAALTKYLGAADPAVIAELAKLVQSAGVSLASQNADIVGGGNKVGQASGGSSVNIR
jgi:hypothetical protein